MSNLYIPDFFQIPRKKKMFFEEIVNAIEAALTGWVESDDDSKVFFGELVEQLFCTLYMMDHDQVLCGCTPPAYRHPTPTRA